MFSPKKRVPPTSMTTRSTTARVQTKKIHATSVISPSRPVLRERENKHVAPPMTPPKKSSKTPKSPYDSPSSPIASAKKVTARPVRQLIKEETAKLTKSTETRDVKSETLFSPAYKIEALDENHRQPDSNTKVDGSAVIEVEIETTTCTTQVNVEEEDCEDEFDPFLFIKNLPPLPIDTKPRKFLLPKRVRGTPPICLALDLDETLVHCSIQPIEKAELTFSVAFNGTEYKVYVRMRPYLAKFLRQVSTWFEIVVFTASQRVYADKLLNILDPKRRYIKHRVFRDSCVCVDGNYLKEIGRAVQQECRDRSRMPSSA
eukprot:TRINITY_DN6864_c0_g2_i1.p1 TRINITY_DN6864_c0_g2~~TRINITY_DN6864_c0_g2_i1.p1  ORF type:complete len:316 (-),score=27.27 TRINITY_DN6864_c0_g2_i1:11-958(-)